MTTNQPDAAAPAVYIDKLLSIRVGALRTGPAHHPLDAERRLAALKKDCVRGTARYSKGQTWIAYLEDLHGMPLAYSENQPDEATAKALAEEAFAALKAHNL